jgi:hypothetical protein
MMHTPGPWEVINERSDVCVRARAQTICLVTGGLDDLFESGLYGPVATANAHLIAAAPDLLAALKEALNFIEGDRDFMLGNAYPEDYAMRERIKAAIAKAEGRAELHKGQQ